MRPSIGIRDRARAARTEVAGGPGGSAARRTTITLAGVSAASAPAGSSVPLSVADALVDQLRDWGESGSSATRATVLAESWPRSSATRRSGLSRFATERKERAARWLRSWPLVAPGIAVGPWRQHGGDAATRCEGSVTGGDRSAVSLPSHDHPKGGREDHESNRRRSEVHRVGAYGQRAECNDPHTTRAVGVDPRGVMAPPRRDRAQVDQ